MSTRRMLVAALATLFAVLGPLAALAVGDGSGGGGLGTTTTAQTATTVTTTVGGAPILVGTQTVIVGGTTTTLTYGTPTGVTTTPTSTSTTPVTPPSTLASPAGTAFANRGMWIWELPATEGGNVAKLIAKAHRYSVGTLYIKSGDGNAVWSQFTPSLVKTLHAAGLKVCAWQYVYGNYPAIEAQVGAQAVQDGADCLVIDAEAEYQGRYVQAADYIADLRQRIGTNFPVALAGLPYVDYHVGFPYSVFLGPGGAQFNMPQMYWQDIGTTVDKVYAHTFEFNELYQRPILPLGQTFDAAPAVQIRRFRSIGLAYRSSYYSWWDWQAANPSEFGAVAAAVKAIAGYIPQRTVASLGPGAVGDIVRWAQQHLWNTHERVTIDGSYGLSTVTAVKRFQSAHHLAATGVINPQTWNLLLAVKPPQLTYTLVHKKLVAKVVTKSGTTTTATTATVPATTTTPTATTTSTTTATATNFTATSPTPAA